MITVLVIPGVVVWGCGLGLPPPDPMSPASFISPSVTPVSAMFKQHHGLGYLLSKCSGE